MTDLIEIPQIKFKITWREKHVVQGDEDDFEMWRKSEIFLATDEDAAEALWAEKYAHRAINGELYDIEEVFDESDTEDPKKISFRVTPRPAALCGIYSDLPELLWHIQRQDGAVVAFFRYETDAELCATALNTATGS